MHAKLRIKAHKRKTNKPLERYDVGKLTYESIRKEYQIETENRFEALLEVVTEETQPEELLKDMENIWKKCAADKLGSLKKIKAKPWISKEVIELARHKRKAKSDKNLFEYKRLKKEIRQMIRRDKQIWLNEQCEAISACNRDNLSKDIVTRLRRDCEGIFETNERGIYYLTIRR